MSDLALSTSNSVSSTGAVSQNNVENKLIDDKTNEIQEKLTSQDNLEKLGTKKSSGKIGRIMTGIAGGLLLAAGLAAAAVATVASFGLAVPGAIAAVAAAVGVTGASITSGVTGAASIGCLVGSIVSGRKAEVFVEGQNNKHNTDDNLAMITNGKVANHNEASPEELKLRKDRADYKNLDKVSGLTHSFISGKLARSNNFMLSRDKFNFVQLHANFYSKTGFEYITDAVDMSDNNQPKLLDPKHEYALKPEYITDYVKNVIEMCKGTSFEFSMENIALVRYAMGLCYEYPDKLALAANTLPAFTNEKFVDEISSFIQNEMTNLKDSVNDEEQEKYNLLSIFKAALRLSQADIDKLGELEKNKPEQIKEEDEQFLSVKLNFSKMVSTDAGHFLQLLYVLFFFNCLFFQMKFRFVKKM